MHVCRARSPYEGSEVIVTAIAAIDRVGLLGDGTQMPWHLPRDLRRFRKHTLGKPVIMGRKTFESLPGPLDGRLNIVLSHNCAYRREGCRSTGSFEEALAIAQDDTRRSGAAEVMIIGGSVVFEQTVSLWDRLLLTVVEGDFQGSVFFPLKKLKVKRLSLVEQEHFGADAKNPYPNWFLTLERTTADHPDSQNFDLVGWLKNLRSPG